MNIQQSIAKATAKNSNDDNNQGVSTLSDKKYIICDGTDYRTISEIMTASGDRQNHATSRNILLSALKKIAYQVLPIYSIPTTPDNVEAMVKSQEFQDGVADLLFMAYNNHQISETTIK